VALRRVLALGIALALCGCASWSRTREEVVNPLHALLHRDYPQALEAMDPRALEALFRDSEAARPSRDLLALFGRVADARSHIDRVDLEADPPHPAWLNLRVEGEDAEGRPLVVFQDKQVTVARGPDGWRITSDHPDEIRRAPMPPVRFVDETLLRGLWFQHQAAEITDAQGRPQKFIYGSGAAAIDVDADGWDDVVLLRGRHIELFLNREGQFENASAEWGLGEMGEGILTAALPLDFDDDGRMDLFVGAELAQPLLLRNRGDGFELVPDSGIRTPERTINAVAADFDGDGLVDLYLANHQDVYHEAPDPPGAADNAEPDQLFLNAGDGRFRDATRESGIRNTGWALAPAAADYDGDGDVDLFVGNDFGPDRLFRNDGRAHFEEVSGQAGVDLPVASMSADWGDYDADGDLDLFVGGMFSGSGWVLEVPDFRIRRVPWVLDWMFRPYVREAVRSWFRGNRFYENQGDGTFLERAAESGAADNGWAWSSVWLDFDNDGLLDVYGANGFLSGPLKDDL
jgi:hypothetical protein